MIRTGDHGPSVTALQDELRTLGYYGGPLDAVFGQLTQDAVTAFQELDMWMSGALGMPGAPMVEIDDKYRMAKHGMDKWSFRKKVR